MTDTQKTEPEIVDETDAATATQGQVLSLGGLFGRNISGLPILALLIIGLSLATDTFLTGTNLDNLGRQVSIYAIIAIGELLVILTAGIDLSVGSIVGLSGAITAQMVFETSSAGNAL